MTMRPPVFEISRPAELTSPLIFSSPHSGSYYPPEFLEASRLTPLALRSSEDCYVDRLFSAAPSFGAFLIKANYPRAFLDLNREAYELDPAMFKGGLPPYANSSSPRVAAGLGTIPRLVAEAAPIYKNQLAIEEGLERINSFYFPFHLALQELISKVKAQFGYCLLIDCHSMPKLLTKGSSTTGGFLSSKRQSVDFVVGDNFGTACDGSLSTFVSQFFRDHGYSVTHNQPYAGGYITRRYGRPRQLTHAIQLEIGRNLYMNSRTLEPNDGFQLLQRLLTDFVRAITSFEFLHQAAE